VQIFDVADIAAAVQKLVNNFVLAISFVGSFVILSGMLILIGSIALTKSQRIYENAILKTLGAKRATLAAILFAEYGLLGVLAGSSARASPRFCLLPRQNTSLKSNGSSILP
jgi:putative ABC transport system permease protein